MKKILFISCLLISTPALAELWATGNCLTQTGEKIDYMLHDGKGFISYDGSTPDVIFSKKDGDIGIITHIGNKANLTMAIDLNTGRGYAIMKSDTGKTLETNVSCKLSSINR